MQRQQLPETFLNGGILIGTVKFKLLPVLPAVLASLSLCASVMAASAQPSGREEMLLFYEEDDLIVTATKQPVSLSKVPAVATVITGEQIRNMGARSLIEAIKTVPGIGVWQDFVHDIEIEVRGVRSFNSEKVLVLLDGNRLNNEINGGAIHVFADMPTDNIKRIEVIRGPVSALYGANAFVGVINIITREGGEINGVEATAGGGSWSTRRYNLLAGRRFGEFDIAAQVDYLESDGDRNRVERDAAGASGRTDNWRQRIDAGVIASWKGLRFLYRHTHKDIGPYLGAANAVNDETHVHWTSDIGELRWQGALTDNLDVTARVYGKLLKFDAFWELFSEGGPYPDGMLANPRLRSRNYGAELQADYKLFKDNLLTVGLNMEQMKQYDVELWANYQMVLVGGVPVPAPLGSFQSLTSWANWNENSHRTIKAWYLQDSWKVTDRLNLIAGVRHDEYSDVGSATNPRAGLVWEAMKDTYVKVLAGRAFRAPTTEELHNQNNPSVTGNHGLDPEVINTTELSVETKAVRNTTLKVSYFKNYIRDIISLQSNPSGGFQFQNSGRSRIAGLEAEARYDFTKSDHAYANFTWLEPKRLGSGGEITDVPKWRTNIGGNVLLAKYFNINTNLFISGDRPRAAGDWRKDIPSYALLDMAITWKNRIKGLEIMLTAKNLLNKRYDDPAPVEKVAGDYPRNGREIYLEARYHFQ